MFWQVSIWELDCVDRRGTLHHVLEQSNSLMDFVANVWERPTGADELGLERLAILFTQEAIVVHDNLNHHPA